MIEKRIFCRLTPDAPIKVSLVKRNQKAASMAGLIIDFSETGLSFLSKDYVDFQDNSLVDIEFNLRDSLVKTSGQLRWVEKAGNQYRYGVFFITNDVNEFKSKLRTIYENSNIGYFIFEVTVYLKDVNVFGTGYFSRYFDWQGMAREEYFMTVKDYGDIIQKGIKLITKSAWIDYQNHCTIFDHLVIKIQNRTIKKFSFEMLFTYFHKYTGKPIAAGGQVLVFTDQRGKLIPIPDQILDVIRKHKAS